MRLGKGLSAPFFVMAGLVAVASLSQSDLFRTIGGHLIEAAYAKDNSSRGNYRRQVSDQSSNRDQRSNSDRDRRSDDTKNSDNLGKKDDNSGQYQRSNSNSDGDRRSDDTKNSDNRGKDGDNSGQSGRTTAKVDSPPPDNLVDFMKWLAQPPPPPLPSVSTPSKTTAAPPPGGRSGPRPNTGHGWTTVVKLPPPTPSNKHDTPAPVRKAAAPAADTKAAAPAGSNPGARVIKTARGRLARPGSILGPQGAYRMTELLAVNLDKAAVDAVRKHGASAGETIALPNLTVTVLKPAAQEDIASLFSRLSNQMQSTDFVFNYVYRPVGNLSDVGQGVSGTKGCTPQRCYGYTMVGWQPQLAECAADIKVGVIDTGYDKRHPAFIGRVFREPTSAQLPLPGPPAPNGHGTGVLSLLAGNANSATPGLIPRAQFSVANAFFDDGRGNPISDTLSLLRALRFMWEGNVKVVNMSMAGPEDALLHRVVQDMAAMGIVIVAAAGNEGADAPPSYPAAYPEVIAVTAVDQNLKNYVYANRGAHIDVAAPGVEIWTAMSGGREGSQTGTSFAAPFVTAIVAATYPTAEWRRGVPENPKSVLLARLSTKDLGKKQIFGRGLLQAPTTCRPGEEPALAERDNNPMAESLWPGVVQRLSFQHQN